MQLIAAVILGIIQGLTEFLPISSSAHLLIVPWLLGWKPEGIAFDVALHLGTALSVLIFFRREWILLAKETIQGLIQGSPFGNPERKLAWFLVVGTIPAAIAGWKLEDTVENVFRSPLVTIFTLIIFAVLLYAAERKSRKTRTMESYGWADSILIGISQAVALIPGVSRSGITMTTALFRNSNRESAARFSFLLSTPIIVGAGTLEGWRLIRMLRDPAAGAAVLQWPVLLVGVVCAAGTGILCIRYFLRFLQTKTFTVFVIYRFILAAIVLIFYLNNLV
jgi:undecaprenyl-diphosphatase